MLLPKKALLASQEWTLKLDKLERATREAQASKAQADARLKDATEAIATIAAAAEENGEKGRKLRLDNTKLRAALPPSARRSDAITGPVDAVVLFGDRGKWPRHVRKRMAATRFVLTNVWGGPIPRAARRAQPRARAATT